MFYASINIGSMISTIATPYLRSAAVLSQSVDVKFYCVFYIYLLRINNVRCISMLRCNHQTSIVVHTCMCNIHLLSLGIYDAFKSQICLKIIYGDRRWLIDFKMFILLRGMKSMHLFIQFANLNSFNHFHLKLCTKFCGAIYRVVTGVQNCLMTIISDGCRVWVTRLASLSPLVSLPHSCSWPSVSWTKFWISKS